MAGLHRAAVTSSRTHPLPRLCENSTDATGQGRGISLSFHTVSTARYWLHGTAAWVTAHETRSLPLLGSDVERIQRILFVLSLLLCSFPEPAIPQVQW